MNAAPRPQPAEPPRRAESTAVIRFAGDSGDGIQVTGTQFGLAAALGGHDFATFPNFPSEIRAPAGSRFGVSSFQIQVAGLDIHTPGDAVDCLVAFNPAALATNLAALKPGAILIVDVSTFRERDLAKAGYTASPLADGSLDAYRTLPVDLTAATRDAAAAAGAAATKKEVDRARNMYALGLVLWLYDGTIAATRAWLEAKFARTPHIRDVNAAALEAAYAAAPALALSHGVAPVRVAPAARTPGTYRSVTGNEALSFGLVAGALGHRLEPVYCSYPITPASTILHTLARLGERAGVRVFQAEDEIAAACAAIGASYAGAIGITGTSGPGMALKTEALGLAVAAELPLVVVNVQRGGPSTGLPTKPEQADLFQAVHGRNGEAPLVVLAAATPVECFEMAVAAVDLAVRFMTPVVLMSDGYLANAAEPWRLPDLAALPVAPIDPHRLPEGFAPYRRDPATLARPWVAPGTAGGLHRIGGLERADVTGEVSYAPENHALMTRLRREKIRRVAGAIPEQRVEQGEDYGAVAVVGWGSTHGAIADAVTALRAEGLMVSHVHLRHLSPLPRNLGDLLDGFGRIVVAELNCGQLAALLRQELLVPAEPLTKVAGEPFRVGEIVDAVRRAAGRS